MLSKVLNTVLVLMVGFLIVVIVQMYSYSSDIDEAKNDFFASWKKQEDVNKYIEICQKGNAPLDNGIKKPNSDFMVVRTCAKKFVSLVKAIDDVTDPMPPLSWL